MATNDYCHEDTMPLWLRVIVAVVALLWPLFLYQNAAVLYLNIDIAMFAIFGNQKITMIFLQQAEIPPSTREAFCSLANFLVAGKSP